MKTDAYTKTVLTIIAGCMLIMVARTFENPGLAFAQSAQKTAPTPKPAVQHVVIDGIQHVTIDDLGPMMSLRGLPVTLSANPTGPDPVHVVLDEIGGGLRVRGLPVSFQGAPTLTGSPQHVIVDSDRLVRWEYAAGGCSMSADLNGMAAAGWEFVQMLFSESDMQHYRDPAKSCVAIFKRLK